MANSILIVEDDETLANNIRLYLERSQWEAHAVHSAEAGQTLPADVIGHAMSYKEGRP